MAQNIYLVSEALNIKCCAIGGFIDKDIEKIIDLDPESEVVLYLIAIGAPKKINKNKNKR